MVVTFSTVRLGGGQVCRLLIEIPTCCRSREESGVSKDKTIAQTHGSDAMDQVSGWLDMFPETADQAAATERTESSAFSIPFSDWCIIPVALLFILGDMLFQIYG